MMRSRSWLCWALAAAFASTAVALPVAPALAARSTRTQQEATAASLATAALLYNYGRRRNTTNGVLALAGAAGTAYLWNKYSQERRGEKRAQTARLNYYRRRASYYHRLARHYHRSPAHRVVSHRRR